MLACDVPPLEIVLLIHYDEGKGSTYKIQQDMPTSQSSVMFLQKIHLLVKADLDFLTTSSSTVVEIASMYRSNVVIASICWSKVEIASIC